MCSNRKTPRVCSGNKYFAGSHCDYCVTGQHKPCFQELFLWGTIAHVLNTTVSPGRPAGTAAMPTGIRWWAQHGTLWLGLWGTAVATHSWSCHRGSLTLASHRNYSGYLRSICTKAAPWLGTRPAHPELPAVCCRDAWLRGCGLLKGCRVQHTLPQWASLPHPWPQGRTAGKPELLWQTSARPWLADLPAFFWSPKSGKPNNAPGFKSI